MIQFTYNPEKDALAGARGGCAACWDIYHAHRSRLELDRAVHEFLRHAAPWIKHRRPRESRTRKAVTVEDPQRPTLCRWRTKLLWPAADRADARSHRRYMARGYPG